MKLQQGVFLKRYKRFFADIEWNGRTIVAHVPNTGSMKSCGEAGADCLFSVSDDPKRKLKYTLEMIRAESGAWVGVNTATPNRVVRGALEARLLPHWSDVASVHPEYKITPETRFDFMLECADGARCFVEVKNVSMAVGGVARFPDAPTERGRKHLRELMRLVGEGHAAELVFFVQRGDVTSFGAAGDIDPEYARLLDEARTAGVRVTPVRAALSDGGVAMTAETLPWADA